MAEANHNESGKDILFAITMRQVIFSLEAQCAQWIKLPLNLLK